MGMPKSIFSKYDITLANCHSVWTMIQVGKVWGTWYAPPGWTSFLCTYKALSAFILWSPPTHSSPDISWYGPQWLVKVDLVPCSYWENRFRLCKTFTTETCPAVMFSSTIVINLTSNGNFPEQWFTEWPFNQSMISAVNDKRYISLISAIYHLEAQARLFFILFGLKWLWEKLLQIFASFLMKKILCRCENVTIDVGCILKRWFMN